MKTLTDLAAAAFAARKVPFFGVCDFASLADRLLSCRAAARLPDNPRSVILALFPYRFPDRLPRNLSRYAAVADYHRATAPVMEEVAAALRQAAPDRRFAVFCDNSPIPEVYAASLAGLGAVGDNGLLLNPTFGSYVFISEIVTDAPLPPTGGEITRCSHCGACAAACPGGCIGGGRSNCLSALTQQKGKLTSAQRELIRAGGLCWGCDRCQEVCPVNREAVLMPHPCFGEYRPWLTEAALSDPALREKPYGWRGPAPLRRNWELLYGEEKQDG